MTPPYICPDCKHLFNDHYNVCVKCSFGKTQCKSSFDSLIQSLILEERGRVCEAIEDCGSMGEVIGKGAKAMREIKFRAWDVERKTMLFDIGVFYNENASSIWLKKEMGCPDIIINAKHINRPLASYKVMQFTGLKDKNGKEIYEGDIVRLFDKVLGSIAFLYASWQIMNGNRAGGQLGSFDEDNIEVLGDIYEHPELLEGPKCTEGK